MKKPTSIIAVISVLTFAITSETLRAANLAVDDASNYGGVWINGSNGGSGFSAWTLNNSPGTGFAGAFTGDSSSGLGVGTLNTSGNSFGLFANPSASGATSDAERQLTGGALGVGQLLSFQIGVNFRSPGNRGFDILDGASNIFNLNVGGDDYVVSNATTGNGSLGIAYAGDSIFDVSFTQTSAGGGDWSITRIGSGATGPLTGTYSGAIDGFKFYINGTDAGDQSNIYFNNMSVVPEPSTFTLLAIAFGSLCAVRRHRK